MSIGSSWLGIPPGVGDDRGEDRSITYKLKHVLPLINYAFSNEGVDLQNQMGEKPRNQGKFIEVVYSFTCDSMSCIYFLIVFGHASTSGSTYKTDSKRG